VGWVVSVGSGLLFAVAVSSSTAQMASMIIKNVPIFFSMVFPLFIFPGAR
jgi:hypothetical protein